MAVPDIVCDWNVTYDDVGAYCPTAPAVDDTDSPAAGTITTAAATRAVTTATEAVRAATGGRFGVCTRVARPCAHTGCKGGCGALCCGTSYHDRIDLDPTGRAPVVSVLAVTEGADALAVNEYALVDDRWLLRLPPGTRWPTNTDIAATQPELEVVLDVGYCTPGGPRHVRRCAPRLRTAKKAAGLDCSIPDNVVSVSREGAQFVMTDLSAMLRDGLTGPASTIAAVRRHHPWGVGVASPAGLLDPAAQHRPEDVEVRSGSEALPFLDEFDRVQGDVWTWDWSTDDDVSDWSNLELTIRDAPTTSGTVVASTGDSSLITTTTDFSVGRLWWQTAFDTATVEPGVYWIEGSADVPVEGGAFTFMPARRLIVRPQVTS